MLRQLLHASTVQMTHGSSHQQQQQPLGDHTVHHGRADTQQLPQQPTPGHLDEVSWDCVSGFAVHYRQLSYKL